MGRLTKRMKDAKAKVDRTTLYSTQEALAKVKEATAVKFDETVIRNGAPGPQTKALAKTFLKFTT